MSENNPEREGHSRLRQSAPLVVSAIALALAAGGIGVGAGTLITGADIKNGSITGADIKAGSIASDDIKSGAIQVSDLSKGALTGLDGKDGAQGPAGPAGPKGETGAQGPAGPAGGGSGGSVEIRDANGDVVDHVIPQSATFEPWSGTVTSLWRMIDGKAWRIGADGTWGFHRVHLQIIYLTNDCTGPAYAPTSVAVGTTMEGNYNGNDHPLFVVTSTEKVRNDSEQAAYGYWAEWHDTNGTAPATCRVMYNEWGRSGSDMPVLRQLQEVTRPSPMAAPLTYDRG
jgi:hypothetical protein